MAYPGIPDNLYHNSSGWQKGNELMAAKLRLYLRLMRVHHYIKNVFLFLPLFFSGRLLERQPAISTLVGFAAYCCACSVVYILNDIMDADNDRRHSVKKNRPIASGEISVRSAVILAAVLLVLCLGIQLIAGQWVWRTAKLNAAESWVCLLSYLLLNIAYSRGLKHVPIVDITILTAGFLLRLVYGAALTGIAVSGWLFLTVLTTSFYMALGKRRGELLKQDDTRQVLKSYNQGFLDKSMNMCLTLTIAFYSLWAAEWVGLQSNGLSQPRGLLWTVPVAFLLCMKYSLDIEGDSDGDPVEVILQDKILCAMLVLFVLLAFILLYLPV